MSATDLTVFGNIAQALGTAYTSATGNIWLEFNTQNKRVVDDEGVERIGAGAATLGTDGSLTVSGIPKPGSTNPTSFQCVIKYDLRAVLPHARRTNREIGDFGWMTLTGTNRTVTNKALTSNVATITLDDDHGLRVGDPITIAGVDATFNGDHTITAVTDTTVSYAKTASNVASAAATGTLYSSYMNLALLEEEQAIPAEYQTAFTEAAQAYLDAQATIAGIDDSDSAVAGLIGDELVGPLTTAAFDARAQDVIDAHDAADTTASGDKRFTGFLGWGEATGRARTPNWQQYSMNATEVDVVDSGGSTVNYQRTSIWKQDFAVTATVTISATSGTVAWTIGGQTANIAYDASAATVDAALEALSSVGSGYLTVTGSAGGPYTVTYSELYIRDAGSFRELTVGAGASITWANKWAVDTGYAFGENVYAATGTGSGDGNGIGFFYGSIIESTHRSDGRLGTIHGAAAEVSWSGATATGHVGRMIGFLVTAGRHKNNEGAGVLIDGDADEVYGIYVNGVPEGRTVTDAVTTSGSAVVTSATARFLTLAHRGRIVTGTGIPANTYILSVDSTTQVTLSNNCTASGTITMTLAATAQADTARTAVFGYGTTEFQGRTDHKPGYKNEPAARFYAYPGAASSDPITEWYHTDGTTRRGYVAQAGFLAMKHSIIAWEGATSDQVTTGQIGTEAGSTGGISLGSDGNVYLYRRPGYKTVAVKADNSIRLGRAATASMPTVTSLGGSGSERSAHLFYDTDLDKVKWSTQTAWKEAANVLYATATLDFPSVAAGGQQELTITVTGATTGDTVALGAPSGIEAGLVWNGYVSAADTVKVRVSNITGSAIDPASATWKATVTR